MMTATMEASSDDDDDIERKAGEGGRWSLEVPPPTNMYQFDR
jgi:hypothetical protein